MAGYSLTIPEHHGKGTSKKSIRDARLRLELFEKQGRSCHWCFKLMELNHFRTTEQGRIKENPKFASFEHLIPKCMGGRDTRANKILAHADCNRLRPKRRFPHDPIYGKGVSLTKAHFVDHLYDKPESRNRIKAVPIAETKRILTGQYKPDP